MVRLDSFWVLSKSRIQGSLGLASSLGVKEELQLWRSAACILSSSEEEVTFRDRDLLRTTLRDSFAALRACQVLW